MEMIYDEKTLYDQNWTGPKETRKETDHMAIKIFRILFLLWWCLGLICIITYTSQQQSDYCENDQSFHLECLYLKSGNIPDVLHKMFAEFSFQFVAVILSAILTTIISMIYMRLVKYTKIIFWTYIGLIIFVCSYILCYTINEKFRQPETSNKHKKFLSHFIESLGIYVLVFSVFVLIWTILVAVNYNKKVHSSCKVIREAANAEKHFRFSHFSMSLVHFLIRCLIFIFYACITKKFSNISSDNIRFILNLYNVLMWYWAECFIQNTKTMIMSLNYANWYWTKNKEHLPKNTMMMSAKIVQKFHLGTVAGAYVIGLITWPFVFIINTIIRFIELITNNLFDDKITYVFRYFCNGFPINFLYLDSNAFIISAIHGTDYYESARAAFNIAKRKPGRILVPVQISSLIFLIGSIIIAVFSSILPYSILYGWKTFSHLMDLSTLDFFVPFLFSTFCSFFLARSIFGSMDSAVSTVYYSVLEDYERNDGTIDRPYFMGTALKNLVDI